MSATALDFSGQTILLLGSLLCLGYILSLFLTYSFIVMPGLARLDDQSFVAAFQALETRFQGATSRGNIPALVAFPGAIVSLLVSCVVCFGQANWYWLVSASAFVLMGVLSTARFNLPSNFAIFAEEVSADSAARVRASFDEASWAFWNDFRSVTTFLAMLCVTCALVFY